MQQKKYRRQRKEAAREFMSKYREKRDKTFGMTFQQQMGHFHRQQKTTREKLKALWPKKLRVTLTDCSKSPPSRDPVPSADVRTPVDMYLESLCQSLDVEEEPSSFLDMLNQEDMNMLNSDSGQIESMDKHVGTDASNWLDDLITELDELSSLQTMENNVDFENLVEDMTPDG